MSETSVVRQKQIQTFLSKYHIAAISNNKYIRINKVVIKPSLYIECFFYILIAYRYRGPDLILFRIFVSLFSTRITQKQNFAKFVTISAKIMDIRYFNTIL